MATFAAGSSLALAAVGFWLWRRRSDLWGRFGRGLLIGAVGYFIASAAILGMVALWK